MSTRWQRTDAPRGDDYDERWKRLAAAGQSVHGEADLVEALLRESGGTRVLDGGCGTGRVAIELAERGFMVAGVDLDAGMLSAARRKAPELTWVEADLAQLPALGSDNRSDFGPEFEDGFDLVVLAGNVMIFVDPGSEGRVLEALTAQLVPGGLLVTGFQVRPDRVSLDEYDRLAVAGGLEPVARWATWDREPFAGGDYVVSMHRRRVLPEN